MKRLWILLVGIMLISFSVLGWVGSEIFHQAPPIPQEVVSTDGSVVIPADQIQDGQNVWQAMGGMQIGSIWGHGSYVAPDWTADYLHRESLFVLNEFSQKDFGREYEALNAEQQAAMKQRLQDTMRKNTYDPSTGKITIDAARAKAFEENLKHYSQIFTDGNKDYAIQRGAQ